MVTASLGKIMGMNQGGYGFLFIYIYIYAKPASIEKRKWRKHICTFSSMANKHVNQEKPGSGGYIIQFENGSTCSKENKRCCLRYQI
jgi:hypothetical protein